MIEHAKVLLERLIAFRPVSSASNLDLIGFCRQWLADHGLPCVLLPSADERKAALFAVIGPIREGGVVLSGHTDVVPVDGQHWATDPWSLTTIDGRLYGRGTSDMLGFVALALAAVPAFAAARLRRPLILALSYDEEAGCEGGRLLADRMSRTLPRPEAVIVGEPTGNAIACGHKSYLELQTSIVGRAAHSSRPELGASALVGAARLVTWLDDQNQENARQAAGSRSRFDPPFTTVHCGVLHAGTAAATVAEHAWFTTDIRAVPGQDAAAFARKYRDHARQALSASMASDQPGCRCKIETMADIPPLTPEADGAAEAFMRSIGLTSDGRTFPGATEAGLFQSAGWSTLVCGPGELTRAHKPNEFIEIAELRAAQDMLGKIAARLSRE